MESKLKQYRAIRQRKEFIDNAKTKIKETKDRVFEFLVPKSFKMENKNEDEVLLMENDESHLINLPQFHADSISEETSEVSELEPIEEEKEESWQYFIFKWVIYITMWLTGFIIFLKLQFGAVYFVITALLSIYFNTRTRPKKRGEVSAYSVFNKNCVSIDGTLKAEQFEREIMFGAGSVR